jgi:hypothetical protein
VLEQLREHEDRQKVLRTRKSVRPPVERDW